MPRIRFKGPDEMCEVFGHVFVAWEWEDVSRMHPEHAERLSHNPTFEVEPVAAPEGAKPDGAEPRVGKPGAAEPGRL